MKLAAVVVDAEGDVIWYSTRLREFFLLLQM